VSSWIIVATIYLAITVGLIFAARWMRGDEDDDLRPSRWAYVAAIFWPVFVLVALVAG